MRSLADDDVKGAKSALKLIDDPTKMLSALLIGNNIVNLSASALPLLWQLTYGETDGSDLQQVYLHYLSLFGEITPKTISSIKAEKIFLYSRTDPDNNKSSYPGNIYHQ